MNVGSPGALRAGYACGLCVTSGVPAGAFRAVRAQARPPSAARAAAARTIGRRRPPRFRIRGRASPQAWYSASISRGVRLSIARRFSFSDGVSVPRSSVNGAARMRKVRIDSACETRVLAATTARRTSSLQVGVAHQLASAGASVCPASSASA